MLTFKHAGDKPQFETLRSKNPALAQLMEDLAVYVMDRFKKQVHITQIFRSQAEQEAIYGKGTKKKSPHMRWMAVDLRDWIYTEAEKAVIVEWLKKTCDSTNRLNYIHAAGSRTVWVHQVGKHGMHFHIQYFGPTVYPQSF
jgi:hypothetical protein